MKYTRSLLMLVISSSITITETKEQPTAITVDDLITYAATTSNDYHIAQKKASHNKIVALYEERHTPWITTILEEFSLIKPSIPSGILFKKLITKLSEERRIQSLNGTNVLYTPQPAGTQFLIWGNIQGAFATFMQSIEWLYKEGIIDQTFSITKDNYLLIFNGNMVGPYFHSMETLLVIGLLMQKNPKKVIYIRGPYEHEEGWLNTPLKEQLIYQMPYTFSNQQESATLIDAFFDTLPIAAYISINGTSDLITITSGSIKTSEIGECALLGTLFTKTENGTLAYHALNSPHATVGTVVEKARIITAQNPTDARVIPGLGLLEPINGATQWGILSAPMKNTLTRNTIHNNAFALLTLADTVAASTITLYQTPINTSDTYTRAHASYLISGIRQTATTPPQALTSVFDIGSSIALIQGVPVLGQLALRGAALRINEINTAGGINAHSIRFTVYNDDYIPHKTRSNITKLIDRNIRSVIIPVGSPTLSAYIQELIEGKITVFFPITGSPAFRKADISHIIHFRGSYDDEVYALLHNLITNYGIKKFAFFYQADSYGLGPLAAAENYLHSKGITEWTRVPYSRANTDFTLQAKAILEAQPEAIGFFATAQAGEALIREVGIENCFARQLFGISFFAEETFRRFAERHGIPVMYGSVVPNPVHSDLEIVKDYRNAMNTINKRYDVFSLEAYIATTLFTHAIEQLGDTVTTQNILAYFEQLKDYTFKGLTLHFNPQTRSLAKHIWLEEPGKEEWPKIAITTTTITTQTDLVPSGTILPIGT